MTNIDIEVLNKRAELVIMPTEQCDFRCVYCYEDFEKGGMSKETVQALKLFVRRRIPELEYLNIEWFGGEPMLKQKMILDFMRYVRDSKNAENPQMVITSSATTNGYLLTQDRFVTLVRAGVKSYQITLDGDKEEHDKLRKRADGAGTFDVIWSNLRGMHDTREDFSVKMRLHVNSGNEASLHRLVGRFLDDIGKEDARFSMFIKPLERMGGKNDATLPISESHDGVEKLVEYVKERGIKATTTDPNYVCYASKPNSFVVRSDGTLSKCTVALKADHNNVGRLMREGTIQVNSAKFANWIRGIHSGDIAELGCPADNYPVATRVTEKKVSLTVKSVRI